MINVLRSQHEIELEATVRKMSGMNVLAKAIYDNVAESGDELEFHRGDVVTVIEQNTAGLEGWWLCSLHGKQGIAPGNRLRILPGMYESGPMTADQDVYDVPPSHQWNSPQRQIFDDQDEEYDVPRRQPQVNADAYVPQSPNEIYDVPRASALHPQRGNDDAEIYDIPPTAIPVHGPMMHPDDDQVYNVPSSLMASRRTPDPMDVYDVPPLVSRGPQQTDFHPEEVYDVPPRRPELSSTELINVQNPEEVYDVPPSVARGDPRIDMPFARASPMRQESTDSDVVYDIPQANKNAGRRYIPSGLNSLRRMRREINALSTASASESTQQPVAQVDYIYDVPPQVSRDSNQNAQRSNADDVVDGLLKRLSMNDDLDDKKSHRLSTISKDSFSSFIDDNPMQYNELKVDLNTALEQLIELKQNLEDTVSKLLMMVKRNWRKKENIAGKVQDVQKNFLDVLVAVNHFLMFARGATANAFGAEHSEEPRVPKNVQSGLRKLLVPVEEDAEMLKRALAELDAAQWNIDKLALEDGTDDGVVLDEVDSFVMSSRAVSDDAAQMAVFVHTHAQYIFKKSAELLDESTTSVSTTTSPEKERPAHEIHALQARPLPSVPKSNIVVPAQVPTTVMPGEDAWLEDYDYVALEDKDDQAAENTDTLSGLNKRRTQLLALDKEVTPNIMKSETVKLSIKEKNALSSLEIDVPELMQSLSHCIEQFTNAVEKGNHPHAFVALSKQVILSAHKLVFVGDCIHQRVDVPVVKDAIQRHCNDMCNTLKHTVVSTKLAALQWPAVSAVQDMVDKMYDVAKCAHQFRLTLNNILY